MAVLLRIEIRNFALIDHLIFDPQPGLNVLTGETGAGKSLIIDAISALLGNRIPKTMVRSETDKSIIEGVFSDVDELFGQEDWDRLGIETEDGMLFLSREIFPDGRSLCRINGKNMTVSMLKEIGSRLIDIHGQHEQQAVFSPSNHLILLDRFCKDLLETVQKEYTDCLLRYKACVDRIRDLGSDPETRKRKMEILSYQISEIEEAAWGEGEEALLQERRTRLLFSEKIRAALSSYENTLLGDEGGSPGVLVYLSQAIESLKDVSSLDGNIPPLLEQTENAFYILQETASEVRKITESERESGQRIEDIEDRLHLFSRLKIKYGNSRGQILSTLESAREEYAFFHDSEKKLEELGQERLQLEKLLLERADRIHQIRMKASADISFAISKELEDLEIKNARFSVVLTKRPKERFFSRTGYDEAAFLFSANPGEPEQPLAKIVSGGEASRIMLAIKTILSREDQTPVLIFDEIDAGISGKAAAAVARKLRLIARDHQVFCVTHMAQIAACSQIHYFISKDIKEKRSQTRLSLLSSEARIGEVSRLLAGDASIEASRALAAELIEGYSD